jgi:hypothetical protein
MQSPAAWQPTMPQYAGFSKFLVFNAHERIDTSDLIFGQYDKAA